MPEHGGYKQRSLQFLVDNRIAVGDTIRITAGLTYRGMVMPRYEHSDDAHITLKLDNGYNIGITIDKIRDVSIISSLAAGGGGGAGDAQKDAGGSAAHAAPATPTPSGLSKILLLSTGGTIASRIDYRTGAVTPVLDAEQLVSYVPELAQMADIDTAVLFSEHSENMMPEHWLQMARRINGYADSGYAGIIVSHGTDTMHYTSSFLSFALSGFPIPIALVGAQRSSDRASSDAPLNLIGAARLLTQKGAPRGVYVVMHLDSEDRSIACHAGTRVRKNHTSRRGAFQTMGGKPAFIVSGNQITQNMRGDFFKDGRYHPRIGLDTRVGLVKYHPGYDPGIIDYMVQQGYRAIIFEGTGLGHTGRSTHQSIRRAREKGVFLAMTSQCIDGMVAMTVYENGRDLLEAGVVPLRDMIPETALVKAMWAAGHSENAGQIKQLMLENISSEMSGDGRGPDGGAVPS